MPVKIGRGGPAGLGRCSKIRKELHREERKERKDLRIRARMERNIEGAASAIVDSAVAVHRELGAGLLESTYQACLVHELRHRGFKVATEVTLPVQYKTYRVDAGYRVDMVVDDAIIVENKSVSTVLPIHTAQLVTYLRLSGRTLGFLINWNVRLIRDGLHRVVSGHPR